MTVYKIQNRWNQFIGDAGAKVSYAKDGDSAKHRWVLEDTPDGQRIKNHATGAYLAAAKDAAEVKLIPRAGSDSLDKASLWTMDVVSGSWLSIKTLPPASISLVSRSAGWWTAMGPMFPRARPGGCPSGSSFTSAAQNRPNAIVCTRLP